MGDADFVRIHQDVGELDDLFVDPNTEVNPAVLGERVFDSGVERIPGLEDRRGPPATRSTKRHSLSYQRPSNAWIVCASPPSAASCKWTPRSV